MGCGGSKNAVAVINAESPVVKDNNKEKKHSSINVVISDRSSVVNKDGVYNSSKADIKTSTTKTQNGYIEDESSELSLRQKSPSSNGGHLSHSRNSDECVDGVQKIAVMGSITSVQSICDETGNKSSNKSIKDINQREKSSTSAWSGDSGVFDEGGRLNSGKSLISNPDLISGKPPSGRSMSSAQRKLLRLENNDLDKMDECLSSNSTLNAVDETSMGNFDQSIMSRSKSRLGNEAFDIVLGIPQTGNAKKRPEKLPALTNIERRRTKRKLKTKADIDRKMVEAEERRQIQETEKKMKAKQFQHFPVHTPVELFHGGDAVHVHTSSSPAFNSEVAAPVYTPVELFHAHDVKEATEVKPFQAENLDEEQWKTTLGESRAISCN